MGSKPVPVLYVHHRPDPGGAPTSLLFLIRGLDRRRYRPYVLCPEGPAADLFRRAGLIVYTAPVSTFTHVIDAVYQKARWGLLAYDLGKLPAHWMRLRRAIRDSGARIVHLNECNLAPAAYLGHHLGCKVVWHMRLGLASGRRRTLIRQWMRRWADAVVAIDEDVCLCLEGLPIVRVIHNSVDPERFQPNGRGPKVREALKVPGNTLCVAQIGRLRRSKGAFDFIEAVRLLPRTLRTRACFLLVGGSEYPPEFFRTPKGRLIQRLGIRRDYATEARELVFRYGLESCVQFVDFWDDMPGLYDAVDVAVFPSRLMGIGRPGFEAAACGKPVIATSATGNSDVVVDGVTGLLVPPADPRALGRAITRLLEDGDLRQRLGRAGLEHARANFDYRVNSGLMMQLYDQVLSG